MGGCCASGCSLLVLARFVLVFWFTLIQFAQRSQCKKVYSHLLSIIIILKVFIFAERSHTEKVSSRSLWAIHFHPCRNHSRHLERNVMKRRDLLITALRNLQFRSHILSLAAIIRNKILSSIQKSKIIHHQILIPYN